MQVYTRARLGQPCMQMPLRKAAHDLCLFPGSMAGSNPRDPVTTSDTWIPTDKEAKRYWIKPAHLPSYTYPHVRKVKHHRKCPGHLSKWEERQEVPWALRFKGQEVYVFCCYWWYLLGWHRVSEKWIRQKQPQRWHCRGPFLSAKFKDLMCCLCPHIWM